MTKKLRELYRVDQLPIFQNRMYDSEAEARSCPSGDVCLVEDLETGLVYNALFRPELMAYDARYQNEQAVSELFQKHLEAAIDIVERNMGKSSLVEIGCGKGRFLEMLLQRGFDVTGFDPAYEGINPRIERRNFEPGLGFKASGLILRHVLEHVQNPVEFLIHLRDANNCSGLIYIEVPCFDWIVTHRAWFDIFYEHVNYFRISDFFRLFGNVLECGRVFGDQYLYVVAELASVRFPIYDPEDRINFPADFLENLDKESNERGKTAVWGGASKGVIFTWLRARRNGRIADIVIDINPEKQGKFLPASGLRVYSPDEAMSVLPDGSTVYVMNSNYLEEIRRMSNNRFSYTAIDHE